MRGPVHPVNPIPREPRTRVLAPRSRTTRSKGTRPGTSIDTPISRSCSRVELEHSGIQGLSPKTLARACPSARLENPGGETASDLLAFSQCTRHPTPRYHRPARCRCAACVRARPAVKRSRTRRPDGRLAPCGTPRHCWAWRTRTAPARPSPLPGSAHDPSRQRAGPAPRVPAPSRRRPLRRWPHSQSLGTSDRGSSRTPLPRRAQWRVLNGRYLSRAELDEVLDRAVEIVKR